MWYRFSKTNWVWDIPVRAKDPYAYVKADNKNLAIEKLNSSTNVSRKYNKRGVDNIDEVFCVPMEHVNLVVFDNSNNNG